MEQRLAAGLREGNISTPGIAGVRPPDEDVDFGLECEVLDVAGRQAAFEAANRKNGRPHLVITCPRGRLPTSSSKSL